MATYAFTNAYFLFNSVELSSHVKSITMNLSADMLDDTAMGDTARSFAGGLKSNTIEVEFNADFASGAVDATLAAVGVGGSAAFEIRAVNTTVGSTNPKWTGTALIESYTPLGGSVGDLGAASLTLRVSGAVTRATS